MDVKGTANDNVEQMVEYKTSDLHIEDARDATAKEHSLSLWDTFKVYRRAVFWSACISFSCVMEGYDCNLISSFYALPAFQQKYGIPLGDGSYTISANWQLGISIAANGGMIIGGAFGGYIVEFTGYRRLFLGAYICLAGCIFITFFAPSIEILFAGELLCGICWGVFSCLVNAYGSEILPAKLRTFLLMFVEMCWAIGNLVSAGVLYAFVGNTTKWAYRIPFAIQWAWIVPLSIAVVFAPESPWWLIRKHRLGEAEKTLSRLADSKLGVNPKNTVAMMVHTNELELEMQSGVSYWDCFKGVDLRRTEISCMAMLATSVTCFGIPGYTTYFFELAGLPVSASYQMNIGQTAIGLFANMCGQVNGRFFGRRTLYLWGLGALTVIFFLLAFISFADTKASMWVQSVLLLLWSFSFSQTIGPTGFIIPSEVSSTRLRAKTTSLARMCYYVPTIISNVASPYMLNETEGNWRGKAAFFTAGLALIWYVWAYFRLPESKFRTYEELDILFASRVGAREFTMFDIEPYADDEHKIKSRAKAASNWKKLFGS
jgi:SP family general alpha glucoside:H+ symporter-like MFS transporter